MKPDRRPPKNRDRRAPSKSPRGRSGPPRDRHHPSPPPPPSRGPQLKRERPRPGELGLGIRLVHDDPDVIIIDKPPGLLSAATVEMNKSGRDPLPSAFIAVKQYVRATGKRGARTWIIHRLDKEASGLLVFAKTEKAFEWLKEDFRARRVHRLYLALVEGEFPENQKTGTIRSFLAENEQNLMESVPDSVATRRSGGRDDSGPQLAVTHYRVLASGRGRSLVQLRLQTGRKNQIRVHMAESGHPLVGDDRYTGSGPRPSSRTDRLCLHATELGFTHPTTGQSVRYVSPAPAAFWSLIGAAPPSSSEQSELITDHALPAAPAAPTPTPAPAPRTPPRPDTSWDHVAAWYDNLVGEQGSDHYRLVILPGTQRLLGAAPGSRVLDVACGQGILCHRLANLGIETLGVDASPSLVESARRAVSSKGGTPPPPYVPPRFDVGDARDLAPLNLSGFDAATCVMALMNIDPIEPVLRSCANALKPGGRFVGVILHPAFRAPGQTSWGWDTMGQRDRSPDNRPPEPRQYRRVDGYLSSGQSPIIMNPGKVARGADAIKTWTFHRPLQHYFRALAEAGFLVETIEEWPSLRRSQPGPRAAEENRARREIPMFLGFRAVKR